MSRINDERMVKEWAEQLRGDLALRSDSSTQSKLDLLRRGLDPVEERRFRGRVSVTVRCAPRKHLLGYVYPTAFLPVFVPRASAVYPAKLDGIVPLSPQTQRSGRVPPSWPAGMTPELKRVFKRDPQYIRTYGAYRDTWIEEDRHGTERSHHIEGMTVIDVDAVDVAHPQIPPFIDLFCRCGKRRLRKSDLRVATKREAGILLV